MTGVVNIPGRLFRHIVELSEEFSETLSLTPNNGRLYTSVLSMDRVSYLYAEITDVEGDLFNIDIDITKKLKKFVSAINKKSDKTLTIAYDGDKYTFTYDNYFKFSVPRVAEDYLTKSEIKDINANYKFPVLLSKEDKSLLKTIVQNYKHIDFLYDKTGLIVRGVDEDSIDTMSMVLSTENEYDTSLRVRINSRYLELVTKWSDVFTVCLDQSDYPIKFVLDSIDGLNAYVIVAPCIVQDY